jgi:hypothetical protein
MNVRHLRASGGREEATRIALSFPRLALSFTQLDLNLDELRYWLIKQALTQPLQSPPPPPWSTS